MCINSCFGICSFSKICVILETTHDASASYSSKKPYGRTSTANNRTTPVYTTLSTPGLLLQRFDEHL